MTVQDGYLRVTGRALQQVRLEHLLSGLDGDEHPEVAHGAGAIQATLAGFTEWTDGRRPAVSVGWDWQAAPVRGEPHYQRVGQPRSNLMLVDSRGRDLGIDLTAIHVAIWVDGQRWQRPVATYLSKMYA